MATPRGSNAPVSETLEFDNARAVLSLIGGSESHLDLLAERYHLKATTRDGWIRLEGPKEGVARAKKVLAQLQKAQEGGLVIRKKEFLFALEATEEKRSVALADLHAARVEVSPKKPAVIPKTPSQKAYLDAIRTKDLVFGIGPAGTGKTYLAIACAVAALRREEVKRIVLTRPAVEAGEALGFLPGDLNEKILPFLRPLYDALNEMLEPVEIQRYTEKGSIEIAPLAYMRGRTLSQSFIILDESQNTSTEQMFMFLTRLGPGSKCIVTGDPTQIDLPKTRKSGLIEARQALRNTPGVDFCEFDESDVVRHDLVQRIITAYRHHRGHQMTSMGL
ncbi:phosphate starvation-inducible protein PhoH [Verrucomicrobium sp. GAS474]|uniref:PhoH family protein n=1 Tax=Verrucomicrobium sp. GAS474 TaxID=1882831 RepID=UPI00087B38C1|nr:PhoH family protein [Verrucomicrobium sp. GAS474]SDU19942.1 phosphate starvation-inducible protein PhoH [Verrucomicrobium sp. GAS474]